MTRSLRLSGWLLGLGGLLSACHKESAEPDAYALLQGEWVYSYSTYEEYDATNTWRAHTNSGKALWGPLPMRVSEVDIRNYQTYSRRLTLPPPYTRAKDVLTLAFPAVAANPDMAPNSTRTIVAIPGDSLVLRWRTPEATGAASAYRIVEDHFGRK